MYRRPYVVRRKCRKRPFLMFPKEWLFSSSRDNASWQPGASAICTGPLPPSGGLPGDSSLRISKPRICVWGLCPKLLSLWHLGVASLCPHSVPSSTKSYCTGGRNRFDRTWKTWGSNEVCSTTDSLLYPFIDGTGKTSPQCTVHCGPQKGLCLGHLTGLLVELVTLDSGLCFWAPSGCRDNFLSRKNNL